MTPNEWKQGGEFIELRGRRIFVRQAGTGEALVCLHGFPSASWEWHKLWPELTRHHRAIAPDFLGFGWSDKPARHRYSLLDQADLVESLMRHTDVESVHLLAHDFGDTVAQELLARDLGRRREDRPGLRIRSICLLNGGIFPEAIRMLRVQKLLGARVGPLVAHLMNERRFGRTLDRISGPYTRPTRDEIHGYWTLATANGGRRVIPKIAGYQRERTRRRARWANALTGTDAIPKRLVIGDADPVSGLAMLERYRELVPDADTVRLKDIGHSPHFEAPSRVFEAWDTFMKQNGMR